MLDELKSCDPEIFEAVRHELAEDEADLKAFEERVNEPTISYEQLLKELKRDGKI